MNVTPGVQAAELGAAAENEDANVATLTRVVSVEVPEKLLRSLLG